MSDSRRRPSISRSLNKPGKRVERNSTAYTGRKKPAVGLGSLFSGLVLLIALAGGGYLLMQMRLGVSPFPGARAATRPPTAVVTPTRGVEEFMQLAAAADQAGEYRKAIEYFDQASRRRPSDPEPQRAAARLFVFLNDPLKAEQRARKSLALKANYAPAHAALCMALEWQKRFDEAIAECQAALALDAKLVEGHAYLAEALADREDFDGALKSAQQALDLDAQNTDALRNMGYVYYVFGKYDTALTYYQRALAVNPNLPVVLVGMAKIFITWAAAGTTGAINNNADAAIDLLHQAVTLDAKNAEAQERLGEAYRLRGEFEKSGQAFQKSIEIEPSRISAYTRRGVLRFQRYDFLSAINDYTMAISLSAQISQTIGATDYTFLGYAYQLANRCALARDTMRDAITLNPDNGYLAASAREIDTRCAGK